MIGVGPRARHASNKPGLHEVEGRSITSAFPFSRRSTRTAPPRAPIITSSSFALRRCRIMSSTLSMPTPPHPVGMPQSPPCWPSLVVALIVALLRFPSPPRNLSVAGFRQTLVLRPHHAPIRSPRTGPMSRVMTVAREVRDLGVVAAAFVTPCYPTFHS